MLRLEAGPNPYDRELSDLVGELSTRSEEFRGHWATHNVRLHHKGEKRFNHPVVGELELSYNLIEFPADPGLMAVAYTAEPGSRSAEAFSLLGNWAATEEAQVTFGCLNTGSGPGWAVSLGAVSEAEVNGVRLYYEEHGRGVPIACVHGGGSSAVMWGDAVEQLAVLGRVISYDRRGCGRSERPQRYERTTLSEQADDAAALLDALEAAPAIVIGRSYGGAVAVELTLRHRDRVRALVLLEGDALGLSPAGLQWSRGLLERMREVADRDGIDAVYKAVIDEVMGEGVWDAFPEGVQRLLTANGPALLAELTYVDQEMPDAAAFATITVPILLVAASDSPPEQRDMTERMAEVLPNARLVHVGGGHLVDPAGPEVLTFIEEVVEAG